jgi:hypothetical protein
MKSMRTAAEKLVLFEKLKTAEIWHWKTLVKWLCSGSM